MFLKTSIPETIDTRGFTLFEILVAIFIFSILITALFGSFRFLSGSMDMLGRGTDEIEMGRNAINRIASDLSTIEVSLRPEFTNPEIRETDDIYRVLGETENIDGTTFSRIRFTAPRHISFDEDQRTGMAEIVYYAHQLKDGEIILRRSDQLYPYETFEEKSSDPIVCKNVREFSLIYFDDEASENDTWDSESYDSGYSTPRSIQIVLKIGSEESPNTFSTRVYLEVYREKTS